LIPLAQASVKPNRSDELPGASDLPRALLEILRTMDATATTESATENHRSMEPTPPPAPEPAVATSNGRVMYDALTGMRFVAALVVFLVHFRSRFEAPLPVPNADMAVGFFFVLSGFILTHAYRGGIAPRSQTRFYVARFARIWPLHIACLVTFFAVVGAGVLPDTRAEWLGLLSNVALLHSWNSDQATIIRFNGASWSLSVEAFLYAVFPLLLRLDDRRFTRAYLGIAAATALALIVGEELLARSVVDKHWTSTVCKFFPAMRLLEFASGIAAARWLARRSDRESSSVARDTGGDLLVIGTIVLAFLLIGPRQLAWSAGLREIAPVSLTYLAAGCGYVLPFALLLTWFSRSRGLISALLSSRVAVFLGEISFAVYMVHTPVQIAFMRSASAKLVDWRITLAVSLAATLAASTVLHLWVEKPARELILALWERRLWAQWPALRGEWLSVRGNVLGVASVVVLALCPWAMRTAGKASTESPARAVAATGPAADAAPSAQPKEIGFKDSGFQGVVFKNEARFLAASAGMHRNRFQLKVAYDRLPTAQRDLFVHVFGPDGKVVRHLPARKETAKGPDGKPAQVATVDEPSEKLAGGAGVGVGFWKQDLGTVPADRGPRSMGGHRLDVFQVRRRVGGATKPAGTPEEGRWRG
jgi:peptidoglycan/LPS O-acetylase OafA/YrhL